MNGVSLICTTKVDVNNNADLELRIDISVTFRDHRVDGLAN